MEDKKINEETLNKIYRNAQIALQSISNVSEECENSELSAELKEEYEGYEKMSGEISTALAELKLQPKDINAVKKTMLWSAVKMKTLTDNSCNHLADMMLQGTIMGITELYTILGENGEKLSDNTLSLVKKLLELEEGYEAKLKELLKTQ